MTSSNGLSPAFGCQHRALSRWPEIAVAAFVLAMAVATTYLFPRPYAVLETDHESGHYYNAQLVHRGFPIHNVEHPGTPVFLFGAAVMAVTGDGVENTQAFLNVCYLLVAVLTVCVLLLGSVVGLRGIPPVVRAIAFAFLLSWPPFLLYGSYFCTEAFVPMVGFMLLALLWRSLQEPAGSGVHWPLMAGVVAGTALSVKLTFLPVVIAALVSLVAHMVRGRRSSRKPLLHSVAVLSVTGLSFVIMNLPVLDRLPSVFLKTLLRSDTRLDLSRMGDAAWQAARVLTAATPLYVVGILAACLSIGTFMVRRPASSADGSHGLETSFDLVAAELFAVLGGLFFLYTCVVSVGRSVSFMETGHMLRNASPTSLVIPWMVLLGWKLTQDGRAPSSGLPRIKGAVSAALALLMLTSSAALFLARRQAFVKVHERSQLRTQQAFDEYSSNDARLATWDGSPGDSLGEASFHFWGNYRYASGFFDSELLSRFPGRTFLRLRDVPKIARQTPAVAGSQPASAGSAGAQRGIPIGLRQLWRRSGLRAAWHWFYGLYDHPYGASNDDLWTGESRGVEVSAAAFPVSEAETELDPPAQERLRELLVARAGLSRWQVQRICGEDWVVVDHGHEGG